MTGGKAEIKGLDFSHTMLEVAMQKQNKNPEHPVEFIFGDAASLPFPDEYFDCTGISFAFRNLTFRNPDTPLFLSEVLRTLKKGGRFVIVESSQAKPPVLRKLVHFYMKHIVCRMGQIISGNKGAYQYFSFSVIHFYEPEEIRDILRKAGFSDVSYETLFGGVAAIHVAIK
jgi:demethylmenaquinone methyltransferase/2-methoxy-6-polyprenyl-1,4-benzoquinol methylase